MSSAKSKRVVWCVALLLAGSLTATDALGQQRPGATQPGQIERQFEKPPQPTVEGATINIPAPSQKAPDNAAGIRFVLKRVDVDGVTVYKPDAIRKYYAGSLSKEVSLAQVYQIVDALTARYRNDGYILSQVIVPAQVVEDGAVRLQAIEGYISDVQVQGGNDALRRRARAYGDRLKGAKPLTAGVLERSVLLLNDLPGVQARAVLAPGATPGAAQLVLQLTAKRLGAGISSDSRGSKAQGPQRLFADIDLDNLLGASLTEVREVTTATKELLYVSLAHDQFLGSHGFKFSASGSYVYSKPQELAFIPLDLITKSVTASLGLSYPLVRSRRKNLYLRASLAGFDSDSTIFAVKDTTDRLRAARVGATFDAGDGLGGVNIADLEYSHGIKGLGSSPSDDLYLSRPNGRTDFQKATLYAARIQSLPARFSVMLAANAQYAFTDLLAPELFSFGGEQFGRGYDPSELLNDHGAALKLDVRYATGVGRTALVPYVFGETGRVWQRTKFPGLDDYQSASSAGGGLRLNIGSLISAYVEFAKPLDRIVGQEKNRDPRVFAGLSIQSQ